ncbi:MAG: FKBP-type peptidyl-prolyl cis-trans isomerase, partial [Prochlorococcus sp.]
MADEIITELTTKVLRKSKGAKVAFGDYIAVYYEGRFIDDQVFDSNYDYSKHLPYPQPITAFQNEGNIFVRETSEAYPFSFTLGYGEVIQGWDLGLEGRRLGEVVELTIPAEMAYGETGAGEAIPPSTPLEFTVELVGVNPAPTEENPSPEPFLLPNLKDFGIKTKALGLK